MNRLVSLLVALVAAWLGLANPGPALGAPTVSVQSYTYAGHHNPADVTIATSQRGPPTCIDSITTTHCAVDFWSHGFPARPDGAETYGYDSPALLAQIDSTGTTTEVPASASGRSSVDVGRWHVAANTGTKLVGKSYGLGTVVENPGLAITGFRGAKNPGHALNQIINRGVSPRVLQNTVSSPKVVLRQGSGNYLHLSDNAAVALRPDGQVVTANGRSDFRQHIFDILADAG